MPTHLRFLRWLARVFSLGGKVRIPGKLLRRLFSRSSQLVFIDDFDGDFKITLAFNEHMQSLIFWLGYYNLDIVSLLDRLLRPGMVILDVGANVGELSLVAARRVQPGGQVLAFEPIDRIADELERNCRTNKLDCVQVIRLALAEESGELKIYRPMARFSDGTEHDGLATLYPTVERSLDAGTVSVSTVDEQVRQFGLGRVDLIKIDIEGAEMACLRGAIQTLRSFAPYLLIELQESTATAAGYSAADIVDFLGTLGYEFWRIDRGGTLRQLTRDNLQPSQNVLCTPTGWHP
jgi:FkbM family methyltransferase